MGVQLHILGIAPTQLRLESLKVLSRLRRILEFKHWLDYTQAYCHRREEPPYKLLFDCFALGAPLSVLLDLLGSPSPSHLNVDVDTFDFVAVSLAEREKFFSSFLHRIQLLEVQGRLAFGEVLRLDDLFGGTSSGFLKVLKTVQRVLDALHASYPGLFSVPDGYQTMRKERLQELVETERAHIAFLKMVVDSTAALSSGSRTMERALEGLVVTNTRLRQYHDAVLKEMDSLCAGEWLEQWEHVFRLNDPSTRANIATFYRSVCVNYISLHDFLYEQMEQMAHLEPVLAGHALILLDVLCHIPSRISDYLLKLRTILAFSLPTSPSPKHYGPNSFDSLCITMFHFEEIFGTVDEISRQLRTVHAAQTIRKRAFKWSNAIDPDELGSLLVDDTLILQESGQLHDVFLFEAMLLCCAIGPKSKRDERYDAPNEYAPVYPIRSWVSGPALRKTTPLSLVYAIPTANVKVLRILGSSGFDLEWTDEKGKPHLLEFVTSYNSQQEQWCSLLQSFASSTIHEEDSEPESDSLEEQLPFEISEETILSEDECIDGRRRTHPRPWSLIARKGPRSETSSVLHQIINEREALLSPTLLPSLFNNTATLDAVEPLDPKIPQHIPDAPFTESPNSSFLDPELSVIPDLTGQVTKDARYAEAGGGFADVWKATWDKGDHQVKVAVKALRSRGTPEQEDKMRKRLERELKVWKKLDHPNLAELCGTVSDFGPYESMVCPWLENGTVTRYLERCGDILSMTDRLQLLCEVAEGLDYLHSFGIVHGDLTGSNVLIDGEGRARLGDFGLSALMADFDDCNFSSNLGGAIRWADASLYRSQYEDNEVPVLTTHSDIYSLGSVILEILSGRIPYHYIKSDAQVVIELHKGSKPRRPAPLFVTDPQWALVLRCWADDPEKRPVVAQVLRELQALHRTSLEFRRHTA
ncbi:hypothetical protein AAF712_006676 [Marasmius tenuissimus]|uniref:Protein kinase domain-containing protein n=1 Tax=Marasmius tenuissimus TaxID=585030 RepID=A0ABR2ZYA2_9AGAR|nr:hypothetical protein PM082_018985 [Marasmius tenuissimus]